MSASPAWDTEEGGDRGEATQEFGDFHLSYDDANSTSSRFIATVRCIDNDNEFDCNFPVVNTDWHSSGILPQIKRVGRAWLGFSFPFDVWIHSNRIGYGDVFRRSNLARCTVLPVSSKLITKNSYSEERGVFAVVFWFS